MKINNIKGFQVKSPKSINGVTNLKTTNRLSNLKWSTLTTLIFVLQQLDYIAYIDHYHEFIKSFHVKDAEFNPTGKKGVFGGYSDWNDRAGRYRSLGDGQIDFKTIFSKLTQYGCNVWAVMEWECCIKDAEQGAKEGSKFIGDHIIQATKRRFDDFAGDDIDDEKLRKILGL